MLVEDDYDSWKIRIQRYIRGKPNGKLIWKSIQNGPTPHPMVTDPPPTGSTIVPAPRKKLDSEFNDEENKLEMADTQAEIILSQAYKPHAKKTLKKQEQSTSIVDPLAYIANLLSGFEKQFPPTNNQLRTSFQLQWFAATVAYDGHIVTEPVLMEASRKYGLQYFKDKALLMEAKEKGDVLDAEAEAFRDNVGKHRTL
ncbi:hypothetical protein Tco_0492508 [Tanacetum coccineum]